MQAPSWTAHRSRTPTTVRLVENSACRAVPVAAGPVSAPTTVSRSSADGLLTKFSSGMTSRLRKFGYTEEQIRALAVRDAATLPHPAHEKRSSEETIFKDDNPIVKRAMYAAPMRPALKTEADDDNLHVTAQLWEDVCRPTAGFNSQYEFSNVKLWDAVAPAEQTSGLLPSQIGSDETYGGPEYAMRNWLPEGQDLRLLTWKDFAPMFAARPQWRKGRCAIHTQVAGFLRHLGPKQGIVFDDRGLFRVADVVDFLKTSLYRDDPDGSNMYVLSQLIRHIFDDNKGRYQLFGRDNREIDEATASGASHASTGSRKSSRTDYSFATITKKVPIPVAVRATCGWTPALIRADIVGTLLQPDHRKHLECVVHNTGWDTLASILMEGLIPAGGEKKNTRAHVMCCAFAAPENSAQAGSRRYSPVSILLDTEKVTSGTIPFYVLPNGAIVTHERIPRNYIAVVRPNPPKEYAIYSGDLAIFPLLGVDGDQNFGVEFVCDENNLARAMKSAETMPDCRDYINCAYCGTVIIPGMWLCLGCRRRCQYGSLPGAGKRAASSFGAGNAGAGMASASSSNASHAGVGTPMRVAGAIVGSSTDVLPRRRATLKPLPLHLQSSSSAPLRRPERPSKYEDMTRETRHAIFNHNLTAKTNVEPSSSAASRHPRDKEWDVLRQKLHHYEKFIDERRRHRNDVNGYHDYLSTSSMPFAYKGRKARGSDTIVMQAWLRRTIKVIYHDTFHAISGLDPNCDAYLWGRQACLEMYKKAKALRDADQNFVGPESECSDSTGDEPPGPKRKK